MNHSPNAPTIPAYLMQLAQQHIDSLCADTDGIVFVSLASVDGFELATTATTQASASRLAAMGSSLRALSEALTAETGIAPCRDVFIEGDNGRLLFMSVAHHQYPMVLMVQARTTALLGSILLASKDCCHQIATLSAFN